MSALAIGLLGLAAWLADQGSRSARRVSLRRRLGVAAEGERVRKWSVPHAALWAILAAGLGWVVAGGVGSAVAVASALVASRLRERRRAAASRALGDEQLADAVVSVAAAIRAGRSVPQAIAFAAAEASPPLRESLAALDAAITLGTPFDDAVTEWTLAVGTGDARLVAGVLTLHRRTGGDLPSVLDGVASTLRERRAAAGEVRALTAQARLSGMILGVLPFGFFGFLWLTSRGEIEGAIRSPAGIAAVVLGLMLEGAAFVWIRHLLEVR